MSREEFEAHYTPEEVALEIAATCCGALFRQGASSSHPVHIPSLIGVQDRKYLDATGLVRNALSAISCATPSSTKVSIPSPTSATSNPGNGL
jgi:hypothetical protein